MQTIASRHNRLFKQLVHWHRHPAVCQKAGIGVLEGIHLIQEAHLHAFPLQKLVLSESACRHPEIASLIQEFIVEGSVPAWICPDEWVRDYTNLQVESAIIGVFQRPPWQSLAAFNCEGDAVLLAGVQDPGNFGTILRSSVAMGVNQIICAPGTVDLWGKKVLRAGMGAHFKLQFWRFSSPVEWRTIVAGHSHPPQCLALDLTASDVVYDVNFNNKTLIMLGNEGSGLPAEWSQCATQRVIIPQPGGGDSLNVAVAAGIVLYEMARQRSM